LPRPLVAPRGPASNFTANSRCEECIGRAAHLIEQIRIRPDARVTGPGSSTVINFAYRLDADLVSSSAPGTALATIQRISGSSAFLVARSSSVLKLASTSCRVSSASTRGGGLSFGGGWERALTTRLKPGSGLPHLETTARAMQQRRKGNRASFWKTFFTACGKHVFRASLIAGSPILKGWPYTHRLPLAWHHPGCVGGPCAEQYKHRQ